jgi:tripartite-type tricarboxylate transporter receptor subunit TctC
MNVRPSSAAWPDRPIRLVVPFGAGGPPDFVARVLAEPLAAEMGGTVIVENRPGAGGTVGVMSVSRAAPDGYSLLIGTSAYVLNKALNDQLGYDPVKDFTPICEIADAPNVFSVSAKLGVNTIKEFVEYARKHPTNLNYSSPGTGTTPQLACELLRARAGIAIEHVPYNSGPQAVQALLSGLVQLFCSAVPLVQSHVAAGTVKALAVTSARRWRGMPDVPTMAEAGFDNFILDTMAMLAGPAKMPPDIVDRLYKATQAALAKPAVSQVLEVGGFDVVARSPEQLAARISSEVTMWNDVVTVIGLKRK